jgi:plasmid stabilization system protein ParE
MRFRSFGGERRATTGHARLAKHTEQDLLGNWLHFLKDDIAAADHLVDEFTKTYQSLSEFPNVGNRRPFFRV